MSFLNKRKHIVRHRDKGLRLLNLTNTAIKRDLKTYQEVLNLVKEQVWAHESKQDTITGYAMEIAHRLKIPMHLKGMSFKPVFAHASLFESDAKK